jgi:kynurenine 3-monooxygenase
MVTYSPQIRYSTALREVQRQQAIMDKVMATPNIESKWESEEVDQLILSLL